MSETPDWVRTACARWGSQKRRIWSGRDWLGNIDGYAQSLLGRIRDEREGAGQGVRAQHWPEVFWGDGLDVQRSLLGMPERQLHALHFQYVWDPLWGVTAAKKASYLDIKRTEYFSLVECAETWIYARLESLHRPDAQVLAAAEKIIREALQNAEESSTNDHSGVSVPVPDLNLAALNRPKLALKR